MNQSPLFALRKAVIGFFLCFSKFGLRRPKTALLATLVVTVGSVPGLFRLQLRTDGHALVSGNASEVLYDRTIRHRFGIEDNIVVLIRSNHPDGIFNPETIQRIRDLSAALAQLQGVNPSNVLSLASEPSFRLRPGTLVHE